MLAQEKILLGLTSSDLIQLLILMTLLITSLISYLSLKTTRGFRKASVRPRLWPTDIYLNPFHSKDEQSILNISNSENQIYPIIKKFRKKTGERDPSITVLHSKKEGDQLKLRGQINFKNGGQSEAKLLKVIQKFWLEGRPISSPPEAENIEFLCYPDQEFNISFSVSIPDEKLNEGSLLYGIKWEYEDSEHRSFIETAYFWYDSEDDKWWSNMNKVPYFKNLSKI